MKQLLVLGTVMGLLAMLVQVVPAVGQTPGFTATLSGTQEVPAVMTPAGGEAVFTLSPDGMTLSFTLTVSNINDVFASHIHLAAPGVVGPVVAPLFIGSKIGPFSGLLAQGTITAADLRGPLLGMPLSALVAEIETGNTYVNVHTTANPGGEIRGQINRLMP